MDFVIPGMCLGIKDEKTIEGDFTHVSGGRILASVAGRIHKLVQPDSKVKLSVLPVREACVTPSVGLVVLAKVTAITRRLARCDIISVGDRVLAGKYRGIIRKEDIRSTQIDRAEPSLSFRPGDLVRAKVINIVGSCSGAYTSTCLPSTEECSPVIAQTVAATRAVAGSVQPAPTLGISGASSASTSVTYLLSTAQTELGVVLGFGRPLLSGTATGALGATSGSPLIPSGWWEMICPRTLAKFSRKVAKVSEELLKDICPNSA